MFRRSLFATLALVALFILSGVPGQSPGRSGPDGPPADGRKQPGHGRGLTPVPDSREVTKAPPAQEPGGGSRWALLIGINYEGEEGSTPGVLRNAEPDARQMYKVLIEEFGYTPEQTFLLLGSEKGERRATKGNMEHHLKVILGPGQQPPMGGEAKRKLVGEKDSVLVFFAGHGRFDAELAKKAAYVGEILGAGMKPGPDSKPAQYSGYELADIKRELDRCPARRKLLILDCCYSGQLFNLPFRQSALRLPAAADERIRTESKAFWGLTSARSWQEARDDDKSSPNHSPFTSALIRQMRNLSGYSGEERFSARDLFLRILDDFEAEGIRNQRPSAGPLTDDPGEFYFNPKLTETGREARRQDMPPFNKLESTLPGAEGGWWFESMPWLIPSLREEMLKQLSKRADSTAIDRQGLEVIAHDLSREGPSGRPKPASSLHGLRIGQLKRLLSLRRAPSPTAVLRELIGELEPPPALDKKETGWEAADLHLLALLKHRLEMVEGRDTDKGSQETEKTARGAYRNAVTRYQEELAEELSRRGDAPLKTAPSASPSGKPSAGHYLLALCLADWAHYEMSRFNFEEARALLVQARAIFPPEQRPRQFEVYLLCREAEALRYLGNRDGAAKRLQVAEGVARRLEKGGVLTAFALEHAAWHHLDCWQAEQARQRFEEACKIRESLAQNDVDSLIVALNDAHGLALTRYFAGAPGKAVKDLEALMDRVQNEIKVFEKLGDQNVNYLGDLGRLYQRLADASERLAYCLLMQPIPDYPEAARFYGHVRSLRHRLPPGQSEFTRVRIAYKLALCQSQSEDPRDLADAGRLLNLAERELQNSRKREKISAEQEKKVLLLRVVTSGLVALADADHGKPAPPSAPASASDREALTPADIFQQHLQGPSPAEEGAEPAKQPISEQLRAWLDRRLNEADERSRLQRDDVDLMILAGRILLQRALHEAEHNPPPSDRLHPAERPGVLLIKLAYLVQEHAPSEALAYLRPTFNLIVQSRVAARRASVKSLLDLTSSARTGSRHLKVISHPTLAFYFPQPEEGIVLLDVPHGISRAFSLNDDLKTAREQKRPLRLPTALALELRRLSDQEVVVLWQDAVRQLTARNDAVVFDFKVQVPGVAFQPQFELAQTSPIAVAGATRPPPGETLMPRLP
jgi:tetratricopeptide (TPR) repeat protein